MRRPSMASRSRARSVSCKFGLRVASPHQVRRLRFSLFGAGTCLLALAVLLQRAAADEVAVASSHDTALIEVEPDHNNGAEPFVNAGTTQNGTRNRGLFQWDLTGVIPQGATILSADVLFEVTKDPGCGIANSSFSLYRMLQPWGEGDKVALDNGGGRGAPATAGDATWNDRFFGSSPWATPGGLAGVDFAANPSGSQYIYDVGRSPYTFSSGPELVGDVQTWVNDPQSNFGWMLMSDDESTPFTARRFGSHEDPDHPPLLRIDFEVVPEPSVLILSAIGLIVFGTMTCRKSVLHRNPR